MVTVEESVKEEEKQQEEKQIQIKFMSSIREFKDGQMQFFIPVSFHEFLYSSLWLNELMVITIDRCITTPISSSPPSEGEEEEKEKNKKKIQFYGVPWVLHKQSPTEIIVTVRKEYHELLRPFLRQPLIFTMRKAMQDDISEHDGVANTEKKRRRRVRSGWNWTDTDIRLWKTKKRTLLYGDDEEEQQQQKPRPVEKERGQEQEQEKKQQPMQFVSKVSKVGRRRYINVPFEHRKDIETIVGRDLIVTIEQVITTDKEDVEGLK
jgi:hypothetical protein